MEPISQYYHSHRLKLHFWDWGDNGKPNLILVHGSRDPVCPPRTATTLHRAWPEARWWPVAGGVAEAGHSAFAPAMAAACIKALDEVASRVQNPAT